MYSEQNSNTFLSLYNQIDKLLDQVLMLSFYVPYNEKLQRIIEGGFSISPILKKYHQTFRYFGDLRNQIVHGFRIDHQHYVVASDYAITQIQTLYDHLSQPKSIVDMFGSQSIPTCQDTDTLVSILKQMYTQQCTHIAIYDHIKNFVDIIDESTIVQWLTRCVADHTIPDLDSVILSDMDLSASFEDFCFVSAQTSVYQLRELFVQDFNNDTKKRLGTVLVTQSGKKEEPLLALVTVFDLPVLQSYFIS